MSETRRKRVAYAAEGKVYCRQCAMEFFAFSGGWAFRLDKENLGADDDILREVGFEPIDEALASALWWRDGRSCDGSVCDTVIVKPGLVELPLKH